MDFGAGDLLAGYRIVRVLGRGGMGTVYLADHPRLPRRDAIKVLDSAIADAEFASRFGREGDITAQLRHPNIVTIYDRGEFGGALWIAMQYIEGSDVAALIARGPSVLTTARAVDLIGQAARGLDAAHRQRVLHRDVKPANLLVSQDGVGEQLVVTDFGIARSLDRSTRLTATGSILASFAYASPEQLEGRDLDERADVYALGCTLHEMVTGAVPFPRATPTAVVTAHLTEPPPRPSLLNQMLPGGFDDVIAVALAKNPAHRYPDCASLAAAAHAALYSGVGADVSAPHRVSLPQPPIHLGVNPVGPVSTASFSPPSQGISPGWSLGVAGLVIAAGAVALFVTWAMSHHLVATKHLDAAQVTAGVTKVLVSSYGITDVQDLSCPSGQPSIAGTTFDCTAKIENQNRKITVKVTSDNGTYEVGRPS